MPVEPGVSREQELALAIEQAPGKPEPRIVLACLLVERAQYAQAKRVLEGVTLGPAHEALRGKIARGLGGQPQGKPAPARLRGPGWWSVSWRLVPVVLLALFIAAAPAWAPEGERRWRARRATGVLRDHRASVAAKLEAGSDLSRLASGADEIVAASETIAAALAPADLPEREALEALAVYARVAPTPGALSLVVKALTHTSPRVRLAAAAWIGERPGASDDANDSFFHAHDGELLAAAAADEDVALELFKGFARSRDPALLDFIFAAAGAPERPRLRLEALRKVAEWLSSKYDARAARVLRAAFDRDPSLYPVLGPAVAWLVLPPALPELVDVAKGRRMSPTAVPQFTRVAARKLSLYTTAELDAAWERCPDALVRKVIFEAQTMVSGESP